MTTTTLTTAIARCLAATDVRRTRPGGRLDELDQAGRAQEAFDPEAGLATAEYAIATVAAVGFAGLLLAVLKSDTVRGMLESIISSALSI
jgi:Protein of unknown function (DUF4244)